MMSTLRAAADMVIDTSSLNVHQLQQRVAHAYGGDDRDELRVIVVSFGFKNGVPIDSDMVFDVRFLPNPHWVPELRPQTGLSEAVSSYVLGQPATEPFLQHLLESARHRAARIRAGEQAAGRARHRLHRREAPVHRHRRGAGAAAA